MRYRKTQDRYWLPYSTYALAISLVRDYDRQRSLIQDILRETAVHDGQPRGNSVSDPTAGIAQRIDALSDNVRAIDRALQELPEEYRRAVLNSVRYGGWDNRECPTGHNTRTRWRRRFLWHVAHNMKWV